jgi:predicted nucleic acid-binding protein
MLKCRFGEAKEIMDAIDKDYTQSMALALEIDNQSIWSDGLRFPEQRRIKVWKTEDPIPYV